jgi:hypothetical protein
MSTYFWTVVGSVAAVAAVAIGLIQVRRRREPQSLGDAASTAYGGSADPVVPATGRRPEHLRGRDGLLAELTENLAVRDGRVHLLYGLGGVGKTAVALEMAERVRAAGNKAWEIIVKDADSLKWAAFSILRQLEVPEEEVRRATQGSENPADFFWRHMENQREGWLLVFDQADNPDVLTFDGTPISDGRGWVRGSRSGMVLVTSRHSDATAWGSHIVIHRIQSLSDSDGAMMLLDLAPDAGTQAEAEQLSRAFAGLPLALHMAGCYLSSPESDETTFTAYEGILSRRFPALMGDIGEPSEAHMRESVIFTWELSLRALDSRGMPEARKMLRLLSCFAPGTGVPRALLDLPATGKMLGRRAHPSRDLLRALRSVGLIDYEAVGNGRPVKVVLVHPMVANITRAQISRFRRIIGPYGLTDYDMVLAPAVAARLANEALADLRKRAGGRRSIMVIRSLDDRTPMLSVSPRCDSDPINSRHTGTLAMLDDLAASPAARQLLAVHVHEMLQNESRDLSDGDLANLIRAGAFCVLDLLDFGFGADATEMMELIFDRLHRWGPDPMSGAANMNLKYYAPDIQYGKYITRLI